MVTTRTTRACYVFGGFRLSIDGTMLVRDGAVVPLAPKALRTLLTLVEHSGEVVTKQHLLTEVWPDSFVAETGLTRNISVLRQALGEDGERLIATVARVGYRFTEPVELQAVAVPATRAVGAAAHRRAQVVGRAHELEALRRAFTVAMQSPGRMIAITGEPGIGKSTLAELFLEEVADRCRIARGICTVRSAGTEPHLPILEVLDELTTGEAALTSALRRTAPTWLRHVAVSPVGDGERSEHGEAKSPERLMRELTLFFEAASHDQPLAICIEDLHWTDASTVDVLAHLAARLDRMRLLLVVTYRQHELALRDHPFVRVRAELVAHGQLEEVPVSLLTPGEVRQYVSAMFDGREMSEELPRFVFQKTEGNPLFMADLVRYLQKHSALLNAREQNDVPDSLRALIERLLGDLQPDSRELLSIAAVQGYEFDSATVARVSALPAADVEERLRRIDKVHALITLQREAALPDGTITLAYRFAHVLYQDALNDSIAPSRRLELARRVAEALMTLHAGRTDAIAAQLAQLFETGRDFWQASQYFVAASRNAAARFAFREAADLAVRGLKCLDLTTGVEHSHVLQRELQLTFARLVPLASIEGYASPQAERMSRRLVELGELLGDVPATAAALSATWMIRVVRGEIAAAKAAGVRFVSLARAAANQTLLMNAHMHAQIACHHLGEFQEAQEHSAATLALAPRVPHAERRITIFDPVVASLAESSRNRWITGCLKLALCDADAAVSLGREVRHPDSLAFALVFHGMMSGMRGNWAQCLASTDEGIAVAQDADSVQTLAWNHTVHGWALAHLGRVEEGLAEMVQGIESSRAIMGHVAAPQFSAHMAEVLLLDGQVDEAAACLEGAINLMDANGDTYFAAELHRLTGRCLAASGEEPSALKHLRTALEVAKSQGAKLFELRAALALAEHNRREGCVPLTEALSAFPEPEPWPDVQAARALADRLRL